MSFPEIAPGKHYVLIEHLLELTASIENASNAYGKFLLSHGRHWQAAARPATVRRGIIKRCYLNSQKLVLHSKNDDNQLIYVEGYAVPHLAPTPVFHAWLVDRHGNVVDPTWDQPQHCSYFGVAFNREYVRQATAKGKQDISLIDNYKERWALLRGEVDLSFALYEAPEQSLNHALK